MITIVKAIKEAVKPGDCSEKNKRAASPTGSGQAEGLPYNRVTVSSTARVQVAKLPVA
jgi:hypothetical protein